jgi:WD40 repeat protein
VPGPGKAAPVLLGLSPDATRAAVYSADGSLALFSLAEGKRLGGKEALPGVRALTWTRDGRAVLTAGDDKVVRLWPLPSGDKAELVASKEFPGATGPIIALDCTAGPDLLITAAADGNVRLWNLAEVKLTREQALPGVVAVGLSGDGRQFAAGRTDGSVQVWDLAMGKAIADLSGDAETEARLAALDWAVSLGALEAAFQAQEAARIEAESKGLDDLLKKAGENIAALRKSWPRPRRPARRPATRRGRAEALRRRRRPGRQGARRPARRRPPGPAQGGRRRARGRHDGRGRGDLGRQASEIHLKDAEAEAESYTRPAPATRRRSPRLTRPRRRRRRPRPRRRRTRPRSARPPRPGGSVPWRSASRRFRFVAAVYGDGSSEAWAVASARPVASLPGGPPRLGLDRRRARWGLLRVPRRRVDGPPGDLAALGPPSDHRRRLGRLAVQRSRERREVQPGRPDPRGRRRRTHAVGRHQPVGRLRRAPDQGVEGEAFRRRAEPGLLGRRQEPRVRGADRLARVTEIATGKVTRLFEGHTHHVLGVSFRADGRVLATAGADGAVTAWDMISGERKKKVEGWSKEVTAVQFIGATNQMVTSSADNLIRIVDDNGSEIRVVARVPDFLQTAGAAATARLVLGGGEDGVLRVWDGTTGQSLAAFGVEPEVGTPTAAPGGGAR